MRTGVLSDQAIKHRYVEWFPLDIASQSLMHPMHLQKNIFKGIKIPRQIKQNTTVARFPINDLKNYATFSAPQRSEQAQFYSIMNYRQQLGSNNYSNLETAYEQRINNNHILTPILRPSNDNNLNQVSATLTLDKKEINRLKETLHLIADEDEHGELMKDNETHGDSLARLNKIYRNDSEALASIERAWAKSGADNINSINIE